MRYLDATCLCGLLVVTTLACGSSDSSGGSTGTDGGVSDASSGTAKDGSVDAGEDATPSPSVNGCNLDDAGFVSATATAFGGGAGLTYVPKCLTAAPGASITFNGDFTIHPLAAGVAPSSDSTVPSSELPTSPITSTTSGTTATFTFTEPGVYPFYCTVHYGSGMYGAIWIK